MKLVIMTIVLDGMPYIDRHLPILEKLTIPWEWRIAEGASANTHCTKWCKPQMARLSRDGTTEYLNKISENKNVRLFRKQFWDGKVSMCNACLTDIKEPCVLLQMDVDEFWTPEQLLAIVKMFEDRPEAMRAYFWCRYWLGESIVATSTNGYGNRVGEWLRAFRFKPGMSFGQHEPPVLSGNKGLPITRDETKELGLIFEHYSWSLEQQVAFKERFYGYKDALQAWRNLQANTVWPVDLRKFLPWVGEGASADRVKVSPKSILPVA